MLKDFAKESFDIIIQAGQSNSEGYGFGNVEDPYEPNDRVWYMNNDFTISCATEKVAGNEIQSNYALSFAREYLSSGLLKEGRKLLILRTSVGGTGFLCNDWNLTGRLYLRMMDMIHTALTLNKENRAVVLLWHQGETDAQLGATYSVHYNHLMGLLESVRREFEISELPFVAADFVHHWKNENVDICTPVVNAVRDVCQKCGHGAFVDTDGLLSNFQELRRNPLGWEDTIHFSRKSLYILGKRYFKTFLSLLE